MPSESITKKIKNDQNLKIVLGSDRKEIIRTGFDWGVVQEKSSRVYAATLLVRTLIIKNIFIHQK